MQLPCGERWPARGSTARDRALRALGNGPAARTGPGAHLSPLRHSHAPHLARASALRLDLAGPGDGPYAADRHDADHRHGSLRPP